MLMVKKWLSVVLSILLVFSMSLDVSAAISINVSGNESYTGGGQGTGSGGWAPGNTQNRGSYRLSIYFAPQAMSSDNQYVYNDSGEPVYDWELSKQVGDTISIRDLEYLLD